MSYDYPLLENRMTERELVRAYGGLTPGPREAATEPLDAGDVAAEPGDETRLPALAELPIG